MTHLRFSNSHLYPGARGRADAVAPGPCRIEFGDGVEVSAEVAESDGQLTLAVAPHKTARGTTIAGKRWRLDVTPADDGALALRIAGRVADPAMIR